MHLLRAQIRNILALLLIALMPVAAFSAAGDWSQVSYPLEAQELTAESANPMNTARAPPTARANVMATATALSQTGYLPALDGAATTGASMRFCSPLLPQISKWLSRSWTLQPMWPAKRVPLTSYMVTLQAADIYGRVTQERRLSLKAGMPTR